MSPLCSNESVIRPIVRHRSKILALRKGEQNLLQRTEIKMLIWMMGIMRRDKIRNEGIRARAGVANIREKRREARLRWVGHLERNTQENVLMRTWKMEVGEHGKIGRPKMRWSDVIRKIHKRETNNDTRSTRPENVEIEKNRGADPE